MENKWIAICDDQEEVTKKLQSIIQKICVKNKINIGTKEFYNSFDLLNNIKGCFKVNILLRNFTFYNFKCPISEIKSSI